MNAGQPFHLAAWVLLLAAAAAPAAQPAPLPAQTPEAAALAAQLRTVVLQFLPNPLYADGKRWDLQKKGPRGRLKNDGRWVKVRITGKNPAESLQLRITDMVKEKNRKAFTLHLALPAQVDLERQTWKLDVRLYSGSTRARLRLRASLRCELATRVEQSANWVPDMILRLRVLEANCAYDGLVVEHTAGVGGDAARAIGDVVVGVVKQARPSLERGLLDKANAALVKAGDTREVRVSLTDWLNGKKEKARPAVTAPPPPPRP